MPTTRCGTTRTASRPATASSKRCSVTTATQRRSKNLFEIESRNMPKYGYGVKAYTLSLIECAIEISDGHVSTAQIASILDLGHALLDRPVELIDGVTDVLDELGDHTKMIITKGDLYHQLSRIESSGLQPSSGRPKSWPTRIRPPTGGSSTSTASIRRTS